MKKIILLFLVVVSITAVFGLYKYMHHIAATFIPGYQNNEVCKSHPLIASKDTYEIPKANSIGKGLILKVEDWGDFGFSYSSMKLDVNTSLCEAASVVRPKTSNGVLLSIGNNLNTGYKPFTKIRIDLYIKANSNSNEPYNAEQIIQDLANSFTIQKKSDNTYLLKQVSTFKTDSKGSWVIQSIDDKTYPEINDFHWQSKDGAAWFLQTE